MPTIKKVENGLIAFWDISGMSSDEISYIKETIGAYASLIKDTAFEGIFEEAESNSEKFAKIVAEQGLDKELNALIEDHVLADENFWLYAFDKFIEDVGEELITKSPGGYWIVEDEYISLDAGDDAVAFLKEVEPEYMSYATYIVDNGEGLNIEIYEDGELVNIVSAMPSTDVIEMDLQDMEVL